MAHVFVTRWLTAMSLCVWRRKYLISLQWHSHNLPRAYPWNELLYLCIVYIIYTHMYGCVFSYVLLVYYIYTLIYTFTFFSWHLFFERYIYALFVRVLWKDRVNSIMVRCHEDLYVIVILIVSIFLHISCAPFVYRCFSGRCSCFCILCNIRFGVWFNVS